MNHPDHPATKKQRAAVKRLDAAPWIVAPIAAPLVLLAGAALWFALAFGLTGLGTRMFWLAAFTLDLSIASYVLSPGVFALLRNRRPAALRGRLLLGVGATAAGAMLAAFLVGRGVGSLIALSVAALSALTINQLAFWHLRRE